MKDTISIYYCSRLDAIVELYSNYWSIAAIKDEYGCLPFWTILENEWVFIGEL